ncbi:MAG: hypothetical protein L6R42_002558 [Xanthoria sp. 1 TBL-2021]|nr:MAG: hypothetical protein L6R42_002558 [Xanthoria sp. 1 TBL-2021]
MQQPLAICRSSDFYLSVGKGGDIGAKADNGWTALHQATWKDHRAVVKRLLEEGADSNETDDEGETALHQAAWCGHFVLTKLLLDDGANLNPRDRTGQSPLHQAASNGSIAVVNLLLEKGADPRAEDNDGRKPHSLAEENFHHPCAKILRDKEMDVYGQEVLPDWANIPQTSQPAAHLDSAVIAFLAVDRSRASIEPYGQAGFSTPSKVVTNVDGETSTYFMKTGPDEHMFKGEYESLAALYAAVPSLCPRPLAHGKLRDSPEYFLLTTFIEIDALPGGQSSSLSLAQKLAQVHSTPSAVLQYDDRLCLYQLYQWLNHYALFSGGYREDAMECMEKLVEKYGKEEEEEEDDSSDL